jgi:hypothetical protein
MSGSSSRRKADVGWCRPVSDRNGVRNGVSKPEAGGLLGVFEEGTLEGGALLGSLRLSVRR